MKVPKGIDQNANLRYKGKGNFGGDLIIKIKVRKNPQFRREGNNVHSEISLSVFDLILGC